MFLPKQPYPTYPCLAVIQISCLLRLFKPKYIVLSKYSDLKIMLSMCFGVTVFVLYTRILTFKNLDMQFFKNRDPIPIMGFHCTSSRCRNRYRSRAPTARRRSRRSPTPGSRKSSTRSTTGRRGELIGNRDPRFMRQRVNYAKLLIRL